MSTCHSPRLQGGHLHMAASVTGLGLAHAAGEPAGGYKRELPHTLLLCHPCRWHLSRLLHHDFLAEHSTGCRTGWLRLHD